MLSNNELMGIVKDALNVSECEWIEWKHNNSKPDEIGEYISALANSAALHRQHFGYVIWGITDNGDIVGTEFKPKSAKIGNQELENWLLTQLVPQISFQFYLSQQDGKDLVILEIESAKTNPIRFKDIAYIRIGSYKKKLRDYPEKERDLWTIFQTVPYDETVIKKNVPVNDVTRFLDHKVYYKLLGEPIPSSHDTIINRFLKERIIEKASSDKYNITYNGAILLAKRISDFHQIERKAPRLVVYEKNDRIKARNSLDGTKGYAVGFQGLIKFITDLLPYNEVIKEGIRTDVPLYPEIALRELIANSLIHQDFSIKGSGPLIEIFANRIEISNPGKPLINTLRFIDEPPITRNERVADIMRRLGICEERGSGIDKVISSIELFQLPAPEFRATERSTVAILYAPKPFSEMDKDDRIRACYQHTCLMYITNQKMSNATLRNRFGIKEESYTLVSRIIKDTIEGGFIKQTSENQAKKSSSYIPYWA